MSLAADSPVSSSSEDFAAYLDAELDSKSSGSSPRGPEEEEEEEHGQEAAAESKSKSESDIESKRIKRAKLEELESAQDSMGSTSCRSLEMNLEASSSKNICAHPGSFGDMCIVCGRRFNEESGVTFRYIHKELRLGNDEIFRLRNTCEKFAMPQKALLDACEGSLFLLDFMHMMTKLRPFVHTFLQEASQIFEMYIYTMGERAYALEMAKLLDPKRKYFGNRIISRDDGTQRHQKGLDVVLGQESAVLILDDTENAWTKHKGNLILMERYHFFASSCRQFGFNCRSLSELKSDESKSDGALASILKVLKNIHHIFFDELTENLDGRDVRQVLKIVRKDVLRCCRIVFSRVFPTRFQADKHVLWKMAEQLGATCSKELDLSVTHVVSTDAGTDKSRWATRHNKFLVNPRWIEAANYLWEKQPEENFSVNQTKDQ